MASDFGMLVSRFNTSTPTVSADDTLRELRIDEGGRVYTRLADDRDLTLRYFEDGESVDGTPANDRGIVMLGKNDADSDYQMLRVRDDGSLIVAMESGTDVSGHSDGTGGIFAAADSRGEVGLTTGTWVKIHEVPVASGTVHADGFGYMSDKNTIFQLCLSDDTGTDGHDRADVTEILDAQMTTSARPSDHVEYNRSKDKAGGTNVALVLWAKQLQQGGNGIGSGSINAHTTT
jgi:hypothetical protein